MTVARRGARWVVAAAATVLAVSGCTTTTLEPTSSSPATAVSSSAEVTTGSPDTATGSSDTATGSSDTTDVTSAPATSTAETTPAASVTGSTGTSPTGGDPTTGTDPTTPATTSTATTGFTPAVDAEATAGECPYLTKDEVQSDTGQRMGPTRIRPAEPEPVCEFVRNDGEFLATVRVLQLDTDRAAVEAVDFYVPRAGSNPETRPAGWAGGSLATADGSRYAVSKGTAAVIAETNQKQSVYARLLVVRAIENLGL